MPSLPLTVLLVEDDQAVRSAFSALLEMKGFQVLQAADGLQALEISRQCQGTIHVLISDCVMAGLSGPELGRRLKAERPEIKIIHMSGYTDDTIPPHMTMDEEAVFLGKPVSLTVLLKTIEELFSKDKN